MGIRLFLYFFEQFGIALTISGDSFKITLTDYWEQNLSNRKGQLLWLEKQK